MPKTKGVGWIVVYLLLQMLQHLPQESTYALYSSANEKPSTQCFAEEVMKLAGWLAGWLAGRQNPCDFQDFQNTFEILFALCNKCTALLQQYQCI